MTTLRDTVGLVALHGHGRAARMVARGLRGLRPRTRSAAAGVVAFGDGVRSRRRGDDAFLDDEPAFEALAGTVAIGALHARVDDPDAALGLVDPVALPAIARVGGDPLAIALQGALVGASRLRHELSEAGAALGPAIPEDTLLHLAARSRQRRVVHRLVDALWKAEGGYAVVAALPGVLVGIRDPRGLRPLVLGDVEGATALATDPAALRAMGGTVVRAVAPGEMLVVDGQGVASVQPFPRRAQAPCVQEWLQLGGAEVTAGDGTAWTLRARAGEALGRARDSLGEAIVPASSVVLPAALALAEAARRPVLPVLVDDGATPRVLPEAIAGRALTLVAATIDDTLKPAIAALWSAGAQAVHVRAIVPRCTRVCPYGVWTEAPAEVVDDAVLAGRLGATSVGSLAEPQLREVLTGLNIEGACTACVGGSVPLPLSPESDQLPLFDAAG